MGAVQLVGEVQGIKNRTVTSKGAARTRESDLPEGGLSIIDPVLTVALVLGECAGLLCLTWFLQVRESWRSLGEGNFLLDPFLTDDSLDCPRV